MGDGTTGGEGFAELVARDVRGDVTPTEAAYLRSAAVLDAWADELVALRGRLDEQLAAHKARVDEMFASCLAEGNAGRLRWPQESAELHRKRSRIIHFQNRVLARYREAQRLERERGAERKSTKDDANRALKASLAASLDELRAEVLELRRNVARLEARLEGQAAA